MNRFELCAKRWIPERDDKVQLPPIETNAAAEEVAEPSFEDKPTKGSTEPITIYIKPSFENCTKDDPEKEYNLRLYLRYSYDCFYSLICV